MSEKVFWSQSRIDPKQKHKFKVEIGMDHITGIVWYAKSVNFPTLEFNVNEYQIGNHKFKYPGISTYGDVTLTFVDPRSDVLEYVTALTTAGWGQATNPKEDLIKLYDSGYEKLKSLSYFKIYLINSDGSNKEEWTLLNPFIKSMNFGDLSYDSDELVEFQLVVANDGFNVIKK